MVGVDVCLIADLRQFLGVGGEVGDPVGGDLLGGPVAVGREGVGRDPHQVLATPLARTVDRLVRRQTQLGERSIADGRAGVEGSGGPQVVLGPSHGVVERRHGRTLVR
ncbi:hypothetical protein [Nocardioides sambongensis]|uniref:hypothetical protein n=1 Tax=Nocardioides sambongensis TaxID=2589074 RepID=UPI001127E75C|nr:hypothetical protein [Nocardioides sambongensis]